MKVLRCSRLLLWLADFREPVWMNHMCTSITLWEIPENPLQGSDRQRPSTGLCDVWSELGQVMDHCQHSGINDMPSGA